VTPAFDPAAVGLYVHVPYCASLCGYCDFFRIESESGIPEGFEDLILAEARLYAENAPLLVDTIFFGGGTPSLLPPERLAKLMGSLGAVFRWAPDPEVTLEANPETITVDHLAGWRAAGVTRLSVGVQSLSPAVLSSLERRATAEVALRALALSVEAGYEHVSADCMTAVPGQRTEDLRSTLHVLTGLPLDHLSVYSLELHARTRLWESVLRGERALPEEDEAADLYLWVHDHLLRAGFEHYEVSNFAKPGGRCRHNLRYWQGGETIGLGPSAWSRFRGRLYGNPRSLTDWTNRVARGEPASDRYETLTPEREREDRVIFGLRVSDGIAAADAIGLLEEDGREPGPTLQPLLDHGYAERDGDFLRLTVQGFLMSNEVLTYLLPGKWPRPR
jgi:oxygen-independent coproporphyrinogen-3 oxidase